MTCASRPSLPEIAEAVDLDRGHRDADRPVALDTGGLLRQVGGVAASASTPWSAKHVDAEREKWRTWHPRGFGAREHRMAERLGHEVHERRGQVEIGSLRASSVGSVLGEALYDKLRSIGFEPVRDLLGVNVHPSRHPHDSQRVCRRLQDGWVVSLTRSVIAMRQFSGCGHECLRVW